MASVGSLDGPTISATMHVSADILELFQRGGGAIRDDYTPTKRRRMAVVGHALPDGSFPIGNRGDLAVAEQSVLRIDRRLQSTVYAHIAKRARALRA